MAHLNLCCRQFPRRSIQISFFRILWNAVLHGVMNLACLHASQIKTAAAFKYDRHCDEKHINRFLVFTGHIMRLEYGAVHNSDFLGKPHVETCFLHFSRTDLKQYQEDENEMQRFASLCALKGLPSVRNHQFSCRWC